jgi:hypothetical protein
MVDGGIFSGGIGESDAGWVGEGRRVGVAIRGLGVGDGVPVSVGSGEGDGLTVVAGVSAPVLSAWTTIPWAVTVMAITVGRCSVGYGVGRGEPVIMLQLANAEINMTRMGKGKYLHLDMLSGFAQE